MKPPILFIVLLLTTVASTELTSSPNPKEPSKFITAKTTTTTDTNSVQLSKELFTDNFSQMEENKNKEKEILLQDYFLDNTERNKPNDEQKNSNYFHDQLYDNRDTEKLQVFKEFIPNNFIINEPNDINLKNANDMLTLENFLFQNQLNNHTKNLEPNVKIPDNFLNKANDKPIISNAKLNDMVQTIKKFFSNKVSDITKGDSADYSENGYAANTSVHDVIKTIKDYFNQKAPKNNLKSTQNKVLVPKNFFPPRNMMKDRVLLDDDTSVKNIVNKMTKIKNRVFQHKDNVATSSDEYTSTIDYNNTRREEIVKNFFMDDFFTEGIINNKEPKVLESTDYIPETWINHFKESLNSHITQNPMLNNNNKEYKTTYSSKKHGCSKGHNKDEDYKVHVVKIIFPEKVSSNEGEIVHTVKIPDDFFHETPKYTQNENNLKLQTNKFILPESIIDTDDGGDTVFKKVTTKPEQYIHHAKLVEIPKHKQNFTKTVTLKPELSSAPEHDGRIKIPNNFFPEVLKNSKPSQNFTIVNINDFLPNSEDRAVKNNSGDDFHKSTTLHKTKPYINQKQNSRITDMEKDNVVMKTSHSNVTKDLSKGRKGIILEKNNYKVKSDKTGNLHSINTVDKEIATKLIVESTSAATPPSTFPEVIIKTYPEDYHKILITKHLFKQNNLIYSTKHDIINIMLPLNINFNEITKPRSNSKNYIFLFVEADVGPNYTKDYKGLYIYDNEQARLLLANGRDAAAAIDQSNDIYIAASDGIHIYNHILNTTDKYGNFNKSLIAIAKERGKDVIYVITDEKDLYKITHNGAQSELITSIAKPETIILDYANNLYYYSADNIPFVFNGKTIIPVSNITNKPNYIRLLRPPLVTETGIPAIIDTKSYIIHANGELEIADFEFSVYPTALSVEAITMHYFAYDKNIYRINSRQLYDEIAN